MSRLPSDPPTSAGLLLAPPEAGAEAAQRRARDWHRLLEDTSDLTTALVRDIGRLPLGAGGHGTLCAAWSITVVVLHLAAGDALAASALRGEARLPEATDDEGRLNAFADSLVARARGGTLATALAAFTEARQVLLTALAATPAEERWRSVPWAARPITVFAPAQSRFMETWVHGYDIRRPTAVGHVFDDSAWWVADLAVRTIPYALAKAGRTSDARQVDVELTGTGGGRWARPLPTGGAQLQRVSGPSWAWVLWSSRRLGREPARQFLAVEGGADPAATLDTARAFA